MAAQTRPPRSVRSISAVCSDHGPWLCSISMTSAEATARRSRRIEGQFLDVYDESRGSPRPSSHPLPERPCLHARASTRLAGFRAPGSSRTTKAHTNSLSLPRSLVHVWLPRLDGQVRRRGGVARSVRRFGSVLLESCLRVSLFTRAPPSPPVHVLDTMTSADSRPEWTGIPR